MVVFTVIIGSYDSLKPISVRNESWRYVCITDDLSINANGWELLSIDSLNPPKELSGVRLQRWAKVIGGVKFFECDTIYLDGSHEIVGDVTNVADFDHDIAFKKHPARNCYLQEAEACKRLRKADSALIDTQIKEYSILGLTVDSGMFETGILFRKWNHIIRVFSSIWWADIEHYTHRDQLSVMWAVFQSGINYQVFDYKEFNKYIKIHRHNEEV